MVSRRPKKRLICGFSAHSQAKWAAFSAGAGVIREEFLLQGSSIQLPA
jgi:hypothetical protein